MLPLILKAAKIVGKGKPNVSELARRIGAPRTALYLWRDIPPRYVIKIEKATGGQMKRHQLRGDIFPPQGQ